MDNIKILIVEDRLIIAEGIAAKLRKHNMEVIGIFPSGEEALDSLKNQVPDLVLMDIQLEGALDGISTAKLIHEEYDIPVIYLSDFTDEATVKRASKTFPANYLSKPFNEVDLVRAINIAFTNAMAGHTRPGNILRDHIFIKEENAWIKVAYDDIIYLEANGSYCDVITNETKFIQSISLNHVFDQLSRKNFIRIHRSYAINANKITKIEGNTVFLGKHEVVMSRSNRDDLVGKLKYLHQ
jgi:DNA-binding LytR/AlgR family response regulator